MRAQIDKHIIDRTMIAAVENQDFLPARYPPAPADDGAIGFTGRRRDLPARQAEAFGEQPADLQPFDARAYARSIVGLTE